MRAGPLSSLKVITLLNKQFVNVFLLLRDLPELQNGAKGEPISQLATVVAKAYEASVAQGADDSVNTFVLSPQFELIGHLPFNKPNESPVDEEKYVTFLKNSLAEKLPELGEDSSESQSTD